MSSRKNVNLEKFASNKWFYYEYDEKKRQQVCCASVFEDDNVWKEYKTLRKQGAPKQNKITIIFLELIDSNKSQKHKRNVETYQNIIARQICQ